MTTATGTPVWSLRGTAEQNAIAQAGLDRCRFPFEKLVPQLQAEAGRSFIPVDWDDLSRYNAIMEKASHVHVHDESNGDTGHPISRVVEGRQRVLGLAWYSGRVTLDIGLETDPELAQEVLLAEGAHMVDFFFMTNDHRRLIINALHRDQLPEGYLVNDGEALSLDGHQCSWFDFGDYSMWVGEAFMEAFIEAFSDIRVTIQLGHPVSPVQAQYIEHLLVPPLPPTAKSEAVTGTYRGRAFHKPKCWLIRPSWVKNSLHWTSREVALAAGRQPCKICKP